MSKLVCTSVTHPLRIDSVTVPGGSGRIGMTLCPGRNDNHSAYGEWARDLSTDLDAVATWKPDVLVSLIEEHEFKTLGIPNFADEIEARNLTWMHLPISDGGVPGAAFEREWETAGAKLRIALSGGSRVLIHCRAGLGRTGTLAGRLLVELGAAPELAIDLVRKARAGAIENGAQERHVLQSRAVAGVLSTQHDQVVNVSSVKTAAMEDRALGCLIGLAIGDALGTTIEFKPRDSYEPLTDIIGGGPFRLKPGEWTDDTSMALCLAESLIAFPELNERDLMDRFLRWRDHGENSVTGVCFDIGGATSQALSRYKQSHDPIAGSTDPNSAGNGSLMRLAPIALRWYRQPEIATEMARRQSRTTHGATSAVEACAFYAQQLVIGIATGSKSDVLAPMAFGDSPVNAVALGSWNRERNTIRSSGYVIDTLEAALWAVSRAGNFEQAVLLAANLGDDADSVAAVAGQLAGAIWGLSGIPARWLAVLAQRERIEGLGRKLIQLGAA